MVNMRWVLAMEWEEVEMRGGGLRKRNELRKKTNSRGWWHCMYVLSSNNESTHSIWMQKKLAMIKSEPLGNMKFLLETLNISSTHKKLLSCTWVMGPHLSHAGAKRLITIFKVRRYSKILLCIWHTICITSWSYAKEIMIQFAVLVLTLLYFLWENSHETKQKLIHQTKKLGTNWSRNAGLA
jgi:hypothetical protein